MHIEINMNPTVKAALITAGATVVVGVLTTLNTCQHAIENAEHYRRLYEDAPTKFTRELGEMINHALQGGHPQDVKVRAKAFVAARKEIRSTLMTIRDLFNSEIDELELELEKPQSDPHAIYQILEVLRLKWPKKEQQVSLAVQKLLTEPRGRNTE